MRKLLRRFKKLSLIEKTRFISFFPLLIIAYIFDKLIDIGAFVYWYVTQQSREFLATVAIILIIVVPASIMGYFDETVPTYKGTAIYTAERYVYTNCHEMCNNFIISEDGKVRGFVRSDEENIDKIVSVVAQYDIDNGYKIIECLNEFRNDDYHSAVWLHNYCWTKLGGEVGYAIGLKDKYK